MKVLLKKCCTDIWTCSQVLWMRRLRVLRRLLVKYRAAGKIDKHLYHELYQLSKGNTFKHKRALVEHVRQPSPGYLLSPKLTGYYRSTRLRPRNNVRESSRKKWMPSVRRPRLPVRDDKNASRPRETLWLVRPRRTARTSRECQKRGSCRFETIVMMSTVVISRAWQGLFSPIRISSPTSMTCRDKWRLRSFSRGG